MKIKIILFFILTSVFCSPSFSQSAGFNTTYIVFSINGGLDLYYDLNANTDNYDFDGQALGTFCQNSSGLIFKGAEHNIYKCGGCDLTSTRIYYRVYPTGSPSGSFVSNSLDYFSGFDNGCGGQDQRWEKLDYNVNILSGLSAGNYTIEVYSDASVTCSGGAIYASNSGANYSATFTVSPTTVGGTISGDSEFCSTANTGTLTLSGHTGDIIQWESSTLSDFSESVTEIDNTTASLNFNDLVTTTYYRAVVQSNECSQEYSSVHTVTINPNSWTGTVDNDWNNSLNWCGGVPTSTDAVTIGTQSSSPIITSGNNITVESLTMLSGGSIVINSGANLTVTNAVSVASDATFTIENNANLIQVNDVANTGKITVIKNCSPLYRLDYTMWSSPVSGQNLQELSPETLSNRFYIYNETTDQYNSIDPSVTEFEAGHGYLIRMPNNHPEFVDVETPGTEWTANFVGVPFNGDITVSLSTSLNGYNLVGNPYPSPINVHDFYTNNSGTIDSGSALYFWRKRNDATASTYATVTMAAYTANSQTGGFGDTGSGTFTGDSSEWVINPGQGFFVQATGNNLVFNNNMRRGINNDQFFRMNQEGNQGITISRLWLNISGNNGEFNQMAIAYSDETTNGLDYGWDGKMLENNDNIKLFSIINDTKLSIQAREAFTTTDVVTLGYKAENAGIYTISLDHVDGLFAEGQKIYLNDKLLNSTYNLTEGDYNFSSEAGTFNDRFEVIYTIEGALSIDNHIIDSNEVVVYKDGNSIMINAGTAEINSVNIYDINGRLLYTANSINATTATVNLNAAQQIILLEINTDKGTVNKKFAL